MYILIGKFEKRKIIFMKVFSHVDLHLVENGRRDVGVHVDQAFLFKQRRKWAHRRCQTLNNKNKITKASIKINFELWIWRWFVKSGIALSKFEVEPQP